MFLQGLLINQQQLKNLAENASSLSTDFVGCTEKEIKNRTQIMLATDLNEHLRAARSNLNLDETQVSNLMKTEILQMNKKNANEVSTNINISLKLPSNNI